MGKYSGLIGFLTTVETAPGVFEETTVPRKYYGDVSRSSRSWRPGMSENDNLNVSNQISIVADPYAHENFLYMRWIEWMGHKWKISNIEVEYPRLILTIGDVYNG